MALFSALTFDLIDGYLAKKHKVYSRKLRQNSAQTGLFFWLSVFIHLAFNQTQFIHANMFSVETQGGNLVISFEGAFKKVLLTGTAIKTFTGLYSDIC